MGAAVAGTTKATRMGEGVKALEAQEEATRHRAAGSSIREVAITVAASTMAAEAVAATRAAADRGTRITCRAIGSTRIRAIRTMADNINRTWAAVDPRARSK